MRTAGRRWSVRALAGVLVAGTIAACTPAGTGPTATLVVAAAASLRPAMDDLADAYAAERSVALTVTTDASAALRTQIVEGARVDVFLAADTRNPQSLVEAGLATTLVPFAANAIALVVPGDNPAGIRTPADLGRDGVRLIAAGERVPLTAYADEVITRLAARQPDAADFEAAVRANIASREDNAAAVIARIALGEGDAALVYATDARAAARVAVIPIPEEANVRAVYVGVVPTSAPNPAEARDFLAWVAGPRGQALLEPFGFQAP